MERELSYEELTQALSPGWEHVFVDYGTTALVEKCAWVYFHRRHGEDEMVQVYVKARWSDLETEVGREAVRRSAEGYWSEMLARPGEDLRAAMIEHKEKHQSAK